LEDIQYHLKTQLGISEENYKHCQCFPIYGTGQGSGNSPTVWLVISSVLFNCYEEKAYGAVFESPDCTIRMKLFRSGFVDDTAGYVNKFLEDFSPSPKEMIRMLTHDSQLWSDLLWTSGGALELPKCMYHYWHYQFTLPGRPYLQASQIGPDFFIKTGDRTQTEKVPSLSAYKLYKTLGYYKSPCGSQAKQLQVLMTQCDYHARIVSTSAMTRTEAWTYYFSMYLTSPGYPLPLSHFSASEFQNIERKSLSALIAKCSFNQNKSCQVIFGPARLNGGGFRPFYTEQGAGQLQFMFKHWTSQLPLRSFLRIAVTWAHLLTGVSYSIFYKVHSILPHFDESHWLRSLRNFLRTVNGRLSFEDPFIPPIQRKHDSYIMDHVLASNEFKPHKIRSINYCQLYLQAVTISDIANASGTRIADGILKGDLSLVPSHTKWHLVNQAKPDRTTWRVWRRACNLFSTSGTLHIDLSDWNKSPSKQQLSWSF
jgi:hypothetical protein